MIGKFCSPTSEWSLAAIAWGHWAIGLALAVISLTGLREVDPWWVFGMMGAAALYAFASGRVRQEKAKAAAALEGEESI